jgi:DtxR family transcriptional regulator, Mn-dependent transcriptional regulator
MTSVKAYSVHESTLTPTIEDYLMVIYVMQRDNKDVISARMAEWMGVSAPTVSTTVKRMVRDGWLTLDANQRFVLTEPGTAAATTVLRRHMLSEQLLNRVLGVPWPDVHSEAGRLEHTLSAMTTERMAAILNDPATCPHGNPLPGNEQMLGDLIPLPELALGSTATVVRIDEEGEENRQLLDYLERNGMLPGSAITIVDAMAFNETVTVRCGESDVVLGLAAAGHVHVRPAA